jgi:competence protein ComEA
VNVDGAVQLPGVYSLPLHSRVEDAVEAAGGFTENARPGSINLAALLEDGSHIYVPYHSAEINSGIENGERAYGLSESGEMISLVNINQAPLEVLVTLPGIGPVTALWGNKQYYGRILKRINLVRNFFGGKEQITVVGRILSA